MMSRLHRAHQEVETLTTKRFAEGDVEKPPKKRFKPRFNLPVLNDYHRKADHRY